MRKALLILTVSVPLGMVSCIAVRTQQKVAVTPNEDIRAEYLYKAFVLDHGFRPAEGYKGVWRTWYENGKKMSESPLVENVRHGLCREWDARGNLIASGEYRNGEPYEGTFRDWYYMQDDVHKHCYIITRYCQGKRDGPYSGWTRNGRKLTEGQYANDKREGLWAWWAWDGKMLAVGEYRGGRPWSGAFADYSYDRTRVKYYREGEDVQEPPPFVRTPLQTD